MQPFSFGQQPQTQTFGSSGGAAFGGFSGGGGGSSFGQTATQPQQQGGFGSTFGTTVTSSAAPTFGAATPTFGTTGFGRTATGFGTTPDQQQPTSTGFGANTSTAPTFGTGSGSLFGSGTGTGTGTFGTGTGGTFGATSFGSQPATSSTFGTTGFGAKPATGFGLGTFGTPQQSTGTFGVTSSTAPTFGGGTGGFGTSGFGTSQQQPTFGTTTTTPAFGAKPTGLGTTFGGFGTGTGGLFGSSQPSTFGAQPQQQQQQQIADQHANFVNEQGAFHNSIFNCCKFGDERDGVLANLNFIQASWGFGKGYFNQGTTPVNYNEKNVLYRLKAVGYSFMFNSMNEDGNVVIQIKKPHGKVCEQEAQLITSLQTMIAKPNIFFKVSGSKALSEDLTMIILTADDRTSLRRILATDLAQALLLPQYKAQLESLGITSVTPKIRPSPEQLKAYLDSPPGGLDPRVWKMAQDDNPDPNNMIPMPLLGPAQLKSRLEAQMREANQHTERLRIISDEITNLHNRHANMGAEIKQIKVRFSLIHHKCVTAIVRSVMVQNDTSPVNPEEVEIRRRLEEVEKALNSPIHLRGRLNEMMARIRLQKSGLENRQSSKYAVSGPSVEQAKEFLNQQQDSIVQLAETVKSCMDLVQQMSEEMGEFHEKSMSS